MFRYSAVFILSFSFFVNSLEAKPPFDNGKRVVRSTKNSTEARPFSVPINPFHSSHTFGLRALKNWDSLSKKKQDELQDASKNQLACGISAKLKKDFENAKKNFIDNVLMRSCPISMLHLGIMAEESEDFQKAFSWYVGSLFTNVLYGKSLEEIKKAALNPVKKLEDVIKKFPDGSNFYNNFISVLNKNSCFLSTVQNVSSRAQFLVQQLLSTNGYKSYYIDDDLDTYVVELIEWSSKKQSNDFEILGNIFFMKNVMDKAGYCFSLSKTVNSKYGLALLIEEGFLNYDENRKIFENKDRYIILGRLYWECQKTNNEAKAQLGQYIAEGLITTDKNQKLIKEEKRYETAASLYRDSQTPIALFYLAYLIAEGKIKKDLNNKEISEEDRYEVAARFWRKSGNSDALFNLACLIAEGKIKSGLDDTLISEDDRYEVAARFWRKSGNSDALFNLACLIAEGKIKSLDDTVISEEDKYEVAACLYQKSNIPDALFNLACLIAEGKIKSLDDTVISEENRYEVAACFWRKSGNSDALFNLACLIAAGKIKRGLNNEDISEENKNEILIQLYELSESPNALTNHALLLLEKKDGKEKARDLLIKAMLKGSTRASEYYTTLIGEEIITIPSQSLNQEEENDAQADPAPIEDDDITESSFTSCFDSIQTQVDFECDGNQLYQLDIEKRKNLKGLKKAQKQKERKEFFKKLVTGQSLLQEEKNALFKKSKTVKSIKDHKNEIKVEISSNAQKQFRSCLENYHIKKVWILIDDIKAGGNLGKPEQLSVKHYGENIFSRRISDKDRLVYTLSKNILTIYSCKGHYGQS